MPIGRGEIFSFTSFKNLIEKVKIVLRYSKMSGKNHPDRGIIVTKFDLALRRKISKRAARFQKDYA